MILIAGALIALAVSATLAYFMWRTLQHERRWSAERIALLAADIRNTDESSDDFSLPAPQPMPVDEFLDTTRSKPKNWVGAAAFAAGALVLAMLLLLRDENRSTASLAPAARPSVPESKFPAPLELLALSSEQQDDRLTIQGVLRNPAQGASISQVTAVVLIFNQQGGFLTSARAPVSSEGLVPGAESRFVVNVPGASNVGRYRVSFRTDDHVVPHVDKRSS